MRLFAVFAIVSSCVSVFGQALPATNKGMATGLSGRRAPSFSLPDSSLRQYDILDYRGKWLLINFIATLPANCSHCREVTAKLDALKQKYPDRLTILNIVQSPPENQGTVAKYIADTKTTSAVVFDLSGVSMAYFKATPQNSSFDTPHIFAVNPQGMIVRDWNQAQAMEAIMTPDIEKLMGGGAAKPVTKAK
ncbi:MAG: TlpA disulfide reductase family protein [Acidobacteriota bacterium]